MSERRAVARGLALAFLAGPWERRGLLERAGRTLGERPRWLARLVGDVLLMFDEAPQGAFTRLVEVIERSAVFGRHCGAVGQPQIRLRRLLVGEPTMGLRRWPVPELRTSTEVARWLGLELAELDWFADVRGMNGRASAPGLQHYAFQWLRKRRGGYRLVEAPKNRLKAIQHRVLREVLALVPVHEAAHGFVAQRSALTCARVHAGRSVVLRLDLEEFFPSIGAARVFRVFRSFGYPEEVARVLTGLCTLEVSSAVLDTIPRPDFVELHDPAAIEARARSRRRLRQRHLAQGAPTSPALANLAAFRLDRRLSGVARAIGARYTRYADDLAFSGDEDLTRRAGRLEVLVGAIALEEGFRINHHKTRVMRQSDSQRLVGLVTNAQPHVPRAVRDRLEAVLTNSVRHGLASQNRDNDPHFLESLRGQVTWVEQVNPAHARKLRRLLTALA